MIIASIGTLYIRRRAAEGYRNWYYTVSPTAAVTVPEKRRERERERERWTANDDNTHKHKSDRLYLSVCNLNGDV